MILPVDMVVADGAGSEPRKRHELALDLDFEEVELRRFLDLADVQVVAFVVPGCGLRDVVE